METQRYGTLHRCVTHTQQHPLLQMLDHTAAHHENIAVQNIPTTPEVVLQALPSSVWTQVTDKQPPANDSNIRSAAPT